MSAFPMTCNIAGAQFQRRRLLQEQQQKQAATAPAAVERVATQLSCSAVSMVAIEATLAKTTNHEPLSTNAMAKQQLTSSVMGSSARRGVGLLQSMIGGIMGGALARSTDENGIA